MRVWIDEKSGEELIYIQRDICIYDSNAPSEGFLKSIVEVVPIYAPARQAGVLGCVQLVLFFQS